MEPRRWLGLNLLCKRPFVHEQCVNPDASWTVYETAGRAHPDGYDVAPWISNALKGAKAKASKVSSVSLRHLQAWSRGTSNLWQVAVFSFLSPLFRAWYTRSYSSPPRICICNASDLEHVRRSAGVSRVEPSHSRFGLAPRSQFASSAGALRFTSSALTCTRRTDVWLVGAHSFRETVFR